MHNSDTFINSDTYQDNLVVRKTLIKLFNTFKMKLTILVNKLTKYYANQNEIFTFIYVLKLDIEYKIFLKKVTYICNELKFFSEKQLIIIALQHLDYSSHVLSSEI